jgi:hypothetical protein
MNVYANYQWPKSNNKKVIDLRVCNIIKIGKIIKYQLKTKTRFVVRLIYKWSYLEKIL